jgi:hypothetical protein
VDQQLAPHDAEGALAVRNFSGEIDVCRRGPENFPQQRRRAPDGIGPRFFFTGKLTATPIIRQPSSVHILIEVKLGHPHHLLFLPMGLENGGFISAASSRATISTD